MRTGRFAAASLILLIVMGGCTSDDHGVAVDPSARAIEVVAVIRNPDLPAGTREQLLNRIWIADGESEPFLVGTPVSLDIEDLIEDLIDDLPGDAVAIVWEELTSCPHRVDGADLDADTIRLDLRRVDPGPGKGCDMLAAPSVAFVDPDGAEVQAADVPILRGGPRPIQR